MEVEWIVADLRARGHDVSRWDEVIANWEHPDDPYLWVCLEGVDLDKPSTNPDAKVSVSFRPRIPTKVAFRCPLCWSELVERAIQAARAHAAGAACMPLAVLVPGRVSVPSKSMCSRPTCGHSLSLDAV